MIIPDGCPWGIGAILVEAESGKALAAYADSIPEDDVKELATARGRLWKSRLQERPLSLQLRGDSIAALVMADKLCSSSPALNNLGAELAILLETTLEENIISTDSPRKKRRWWF